MDMAPLFGKSTAGSEMCNPFSSVPYTLFDPTEFLIIERPAAGREGGGGRMTGRTKVDWVETPEAHVFMADMPGMKKDQIKVEVLDGTTLSISGERLKQKRQETDSWRCVERTHGMLRRQFELPKDANSEQVTAKVEDGVLTVTIPKFHNQLPKTRSVDVA